MKDSPYLALYDVVSTALACMMIVLLVGHTVEPKVRTMPCIGTMKDRVGIPVEIDMTCTVEL